MNPLYTKWLEVLHTNTNPYPKDWLCVPTSDDSREMCPLGLLCDASQMGTWQPILKQELLPYIDPTDPQYPLTYTLPSTKIDHNLTSYYGTSILPLELKNHLQLRTAIMAILTEELSDSLQTLFAESFNYGLPDFIAIPDIATKFANNEHHSPANIIEDIIKINPPSLHYKSKKTSANTTTT